LVAREVWPLIIAMPHFITKVLHIIIAKLLVLTTVVMKMKANDMVAWHIRIAKQPTVTVNEAVVALPPWIRRNREKSPEKAEKPPTEDVAATTMTTKEIAVLATDAAAVAGKKMRTITTKNAAVLRGAAVSPPWIRRNGERLLGRAARPLMEDGAVIMTKKKAVIRATDAAAVAGKKMRTMKVKDVVVLRAVAHPNSMLGPAAKVTKTHDHLCSSISTDAVELQIVILK